MWNSLGKVTVASAGTPVRATINLTDPEARLSPNAVQFETWPTNSGFIYIMERQNADKVTGAGILAILPVPTANNLPSQSASIPTAPDSFNVNTIWIDADNSGDAVVVSILVL